MLIFHSSAAAAPRIPSPIHKQIMKQQTHAAIRRSAILRIISDKDTLQSFKLKSFIASLMHQDMPIIAQTP